MIKDRFSNLHKQSKKDYRFAKGENQILKNCSTKKEDIFLDTLFYRFKMNCL